MSGLSLAQEEALERAVESGDLEEIEKIFQKADYVNINEIRYSIGETPLHIACRYGHLEVAQCLTEEQHANVECQDSDGWTPLHFACEGGHLDVAVYLVEEQGANTECQNGDGETPLHFACFYDHLDVAVFLVDTGGADIESENSNGETPLQVAEAAESIQVTNYLKSIYDNRNPASDHSSDESSQSTPADRNRSEINEESSDEKAVLAPDDDTIERLWPYLLEKTGKGDGDTNGDGEVVGSISKRDLKQFLSEYNASKSSLGRSEQQATVSNDSAALSKNEMMIREWLVQALPDLSNADQSQYSGNLLDKGFDSLDLLRTELQPTDLDFMKDVHRRAVCQVYLQSQTSVEVARADGDPSLSKKDIAQPSHEQIASKSGRHPRAQDGCCAIL